MNLKQEALDKKALAMLKADADRAAGAYMRYQASCPECRMLMDSLIRHVAGSFLVYDADLRFEESKNGTSVYCKLCERLVWSDEN